MAPTGIKVGHQHKVLHLRLQEVIEVNQNVLFAGIRWLAAVPEFNCHTNTSSIQVICFSHYRTTLTFTLQGGNGKLPVISTTVSCNV